MIVHQHRETNRGYNLNIFITLHLQSVICPIYKGTLQCLSLQIFYTFTFTFNHPPKEIRFINTQVYSVRYRVSQ